MNSLSQTQSPNYPTPQYGNFFTGYSSSPEFNTQFIGATVKKPLTEQEKTLFEFVVSKQGKVVNTEEVIKFLEYNQDISPHFKSAVAYISKIVNKPFSLKLVLKKDMEIENYRTLFLLIVGNFQSVEAFKLLQKIDREWFSKNKPDTTKFNVNIEFE